MSKRSGQNLRIELRKNNYSPYQLQLTTLQTNAQNNLGFLMLYQRLMQFG